MKFKPHDYQQFAIDFIETHPEAALFLGMGLGKTIITLTAIHNLKYDWADIHKVLIIAPLKVARDTWTAELEKWDHLTGLQMVKILGTPAQRRKALTTPADIYTINRENVPWLVKELGNAWDFDMVVIDELSSFKTHNASRTKALLAARPHIRRIVGLTGTPAPNSLMNLFAQFRVLDNGERLGKYITHFRNKYFTPDKRKDHIVYSWALKKGADQQIYDAIRDITVSMQTCDYITLPEVTYTSHLVKLSKTERKIYNTLKRKHVLELAGTEIAAANPAALMGKLLQLSSGAILDEDGNTHDVHSQKLDALADIIEQAQGNTVLCAYWYKAEAKRILEAFPQARKLSTAEDFQAWCRGEIELGLIQPASAGHGLNLQSGGHIMVWYTTPWDLELVEQANARLHRQGQTEPVSIIHIIAENTVDTQILDALTNKSMGQHALTQAVAAQLRKENQ